jgi:tripartite ATP-independent transporter DctP family solute receptor
MSHRNPSPSVSRRTALALTAGGAATLLGSRSGRAAAPITLKLGHALADTHPSSKRLEHAAAQIRDLSKGRVELRLFPNGQLGSQTDIISQARSGAIDLTMQSSAVLATIAPSASIIGVAFAFRDYAAVWPAMDGDLGKYMRSEFEGANLVVMSRMWDSGYRHVTTSTKPIVTPADLVGFKIRVPASPTWTLLFAALGSAPTSLDLSELYSALQTKIVDGEENPLPLISTSKLYEVQKYCSLTGHIWDGLWILANRRSWSKLPKDLQELVEDQLNQAGLQQRQDLVEADKSVQVELEKAGLVLNKPEIEPFRQKLREAGYYAAMKGRYKPEAWEILTRYTGPIT